MSADDLVYDLDPGTKVPRSDTLERPQIQGRLPAEIFVAYARDLSPADIAALSQPRAVRPRSLVRIHASHHALARCLATGMKIQQAALVTGYSPGRVSALQGDPAFAALVADYRVEAKSIVADMTERMVNMGLDFMEELHERLMEAPETFSIPMILDAVKAFADRTGHGPNQEVTLRVNSDLIDRPPRETYEQWSERRARELTPPEEPKKIN